MLPSLSQLPIGAGGPGALDDDFQPMYARRLADPVQPRPNEAMMGRVVNARGESQQIVDKAEEWRRKMLLRMDARKATGVDRMPGHRTTHRTDPIPPVQWEEGVEVYADGALVNVLASTLGVPEQAVSVQAARSAVLKATGKSSAELARVVSEISNTDDGEELGWSAFGGRLLSAVPALAAVGSTAVIGGTAWVVLALYNAYLLKEKIEEASPWWDWSAVTASLTATAATPLHCLPVERTGSLADRGKIEEEAERHNLNAPCRRGLAAPNA